MSSSLEKNSHPMLLRHGGRIYLEPASYRGGRGLLLTSNTKKRLEANYTSDQEILQTVNNSLSYFDLKIIIWVWKWNFTLLAHSIKEVYLPAFTVLCRQNLHKSVRNWIFLSLIEVSKSGLSFCTWNLPLKKKMRLQNKTITSAIFPFSPKSVNKLAYSFFPCSLLSHPCPWCLQNKNCLLLSLNLGCWITHIQIA